MTPDGPADRGSSRTYARYVLGVLLLTYTFNYLDRYVLTILLEPVKQELGASDTMMGFLIGPAFAVLYTTLGFPIARWADRGSRRSIIALGFAVWSAFTIASGAVRSTLQLAVARIGVGIGEAAGAAPSHSLISDYFPPASRARALSVFQVGVYLGQLLGLVVGGVLVGQIGWRWTFVVVGLPGLVLALVVRFTVREPVRGGLDPAPTAPDPVSIGETVRALWKLPTFRLVAVGAGLASFAGTGYGFWIPTLFRRVHELSFTEIGTQFGLISAVSAAAGSLIAGVLADKLGQRDVRWLLRVPALGVLLSLPCLLGVCLWPTPFGAMAFAIPSGLLGAGWAPPCYSVVQNLVPPAMRAVAAAVLIFFVTMLGMGLGPQVVGFLNDWLEPSLGHLAVRWSLVIVLSTSLLGAGLLALGARRLPEDLGAI
ncbi:MAG: MFS transporter [Myxococcales bacterium]|nr:MFS transporter [Myxococcales bacterium]